jgi:hypothetical protein
MTSVSSSVHPFVAGTGSTMMDLGLVGVCMATAVLVVLREPARCRSSGSGDSELGGSRDNGTLHLRV